MSNGARAGAAGGGGGGGGGGAAGGGAASATMGATMGPRSAASPLRDTTRTLPPIFANANSAAEMQLARLEKALLETRKKFDAERALSAKLAEQLDAHKTRVRELQVQLADKGNLTTQDRMKDKKLQTLENRLDHSLTKFHESEAQNRKLRSAIDELERERQSLEAHNTKLQEQLDAVTREHRAAQELLRTTAVARDAAQGDVRALVSRLEREREEYQTQMLQMQAMIENERRIKDLVHGIDHQGDGSGAPAAPLPAFLISRIRRELPLLDASENVSAKKAAGLLRLVLDQSPSAELAQAESEEAAAAAEAAEAAAKTAAATAEEQQTLKRLVDHLQRQWSKSQQERTLLVAQVVSISHLAGVEVSFDQHTQNLVQQLQLVHDTLQRRTAGAGATAGDGDGDAGAAGAAGPAAVAVRAPSPKPAESERDAPAALAAANAQRRSRTSADSGSAHGDDAYAQESFDEGAAAPAANGGPDGAAAGATASSGASSKLDLTRVAPTATSGPSSAHGSARPPASGGARSARSHTAERPESAAGRPS